jgi:hypothetical protein
MMFYDLRCWKYDRVEFSEAKNLVHEMIEAVEYEGSSPSMCQILKAIGFRCVECNDGRKFLRGQSHCS